MSIGLYHPRVQFVNEVDVIQLSGSGTLRKMIEVK